MLRYQEERVADIWDELYPLAHAHHASTQNYKRHEPFLPKRERYVHYNECGFFRLLTARDHGKLVGYLGVYLTDSMHSQAPILTEDTFYLDPEHRGGRNALRFIQFMEAYFQQAVPVELLFSCELDNLTGIHRLLDYLDYKPVIMVRSKYLPPRADSALAHVTEAPHVGDCQVS